MKPGAQKAQANSPGKPGMLDRFLSAPAPSDPLYLTNRTFSQKAQRAFLLGLPVVMVMAGVIVTIYIFAPKAPKPVKEPTPAEIAAKVLPNFNKDIQLDSNKDLEVQEVHFEHASASLMVGNIRNKSDHLIHEAVVVFDLVDPTGAQLGGITITETNLAPGALRKFQKGIEQQTATAAVVRDVRTQ